jgi:hypothetical protein
MNHITPIDVPSASALRRELQSAYFHDCHQIAVNSSGPSAFDFYLRLASAAPPWINAMMHIRNKIGACFGLKNLGVMNAIDHDKPARDYRIGDRVGIFTIVSISEQEVVLGDADRHLDVKVSVLKLEDAIHPSIAISTVVQVHNTLGRIYMAVVAPVHKIIAPAMLARANFTAKGT